MLLHTVLVFLEIYDHGKTSDLSQSLLALIGRFLEETRQYEKNFLTLLFLYRSSKVMTSQK